MQIVNPDRKVVKDFPCNRVNLQLLDNNLMQYIVDGQLINWFYFEVDTKETGLIDSRTLKYDHVECKNFEDAYIIDIHYLYQKTTKLDWHFTVNENYITCKIIVNTNNKTSSNYLAPMVFPYPNNYVIKQTLSLDQKMLLVPYDNDMWVTYESSHLRPGQTSYDVTAIYDENTNAGVVIGALDFANFKNAIKCSGYDARSYRAISGIADEMTHDCLPHGYVNGEEVESSSFMYGYFRDVRTGLEKYASLLDCKLPWLHGPVFGWNSYSAFGSATTIENVEAAADFVYNKLAKFKNDEEVTYINFDAVGSMKKGELKALIKKLHARKQKVGVYYMPLAHLKEMDGLNLKGSILGTRKNLVLKRPDGSDYPPIDNKYPIDVTNPDAMREIRYQLKEIVETGYDYIKLDFLSHGSLEGIRQNKSITTGRQALNFFYNILKEELDFSKVGRSIFISSSISPLFPAGYAHSRRCCCDCFGHSEDTRYLLNALTFSYWTNDAIYQYNDPDHTVLYQSIVDNMGVTSEEEARSRFNASIISGTNMLLSDNFGPDDNADIKAAKKRAQALCNNKKLVELAKLNKTFKPLKFTNDNNIFYLKNGNKIYIAFFNLTDSKETFSIHSDDINAPEYGKFVSLNDDESATYRDVITVRVKPHSSTIYEVIG